MKEGAIMDKQSFIQFYNDNIEKIYRFAYFKVDSEETAQDLVSEAFLKFWNVIHANDKKIDNHRAFLYQIAKNLIADFYRQKEKSSNIVLASNHPAILNVASEENLIEEINIKSDFEQIKHFIKRIQPEQQEAILLKYVDELETKEIATIMNKSEGAIRILLHRGLIAIKKHYLNC